MIVERLESRIRQLVESNRQLEEMARLRREFLRNVSHELATPLTPIVGYIHMLLATELGELSPEQRRALESLDKSTSRLRGVVDMLLDVSALETGRMTFQMHAYDFGELVATALQEVYQKRSDASSRIVMEACPVGLVAQGDVDKLKRAMIHLLDNALKFSDSDGKVGVSIRLEGSVDDGSATYALYVADQGEGIDIDERNKIMQPFYQSDGSVTREHGGVGLGLAFAKRVADVHGGKLHVDNAAWQVNEVAFSGALMVMRIKAHVNDLSRSSRRDTSA